ncbi:MULTISPECIES: aspartyl-phosphate phosphatase Spo0E family protein [Cytobacillus]|uniref:Spo0E like sporulation regulatory protein n=1 Tax=Cytobacillus oceanisediminis TaxID=665099 RepID=A0ABX3CMZ4_9BACI|nr:aspartyl-phosphate phosphatase Spo0E family protein [Cytobacillus oceanisediminis]OHX45034.1 hypothetical protein BBV17_24225 [Cytobacillus oceanisediminis]
MRIKELNSIIESKRNQMIQSGLQYGFNHYKTIKYSKELDIQLNKYSYQNSLCPKSLKNI